jgi:cobalt-zinc-cadmium resistance protein CzcA
MNGILLITYYNEIREQGARPLEAMFEAASQRMRPMLMTAFSACIGVLPAALSTAMHGPAAEARRRSELGIS